jgi:hypothetical protein
MTPPPPGGAVAGDHGIWQVDRKVGNVRSDCPDLIKTIAELTLTLL